VFAPVFDGFAREQRSESANLFPQPVEGSGTDPSGPQPQDEAPSRSFVNRRGCHRREQRGARADRHEAGGKEQVTGLARERTSVTSASRLATGEQAAADLFGGADDPGEIPPGSPRSANRYRRVVGAPSRWHP
jgi:hypothetical protein